MQQARVRTDFDLTPEQCTYSDAGCNLAPSCLNCPFVRCRYDAPQEIMRYIKGQRDREVQRLRQKGTGIVELAQRFGLSRRTVHRILKTRNPNI